MHGKATWSTLKKTLMSIDIRGDRNNEGMLKSERA